MKGNKKKVNGKECFNRRLMVALLTACMVISLAGCGGSGKSATSMLQTENYAAADSDMNYMSEEMAEAEAGTWDNGSGSSGSSFSGEKAESISDSAAQTNRKLIKTVNMDVETREFDSLMEAIQTQVKTLEGYIESMNTYNGSTYYGYHSTRNADMTIRIPATQLENFLNAISGISNVVRRSDNVEDITLTYVDLQSHKTALETEQTRLLELLERAETIEDIITIEERLSNIRYQIESMGSQLRTYDNKVDYSTVYLNIDEVEVLTPVQEETTWERISGGFVDSLKNIGNGLVEFIIWFVIHLPYLILWAVIVIIIVVVIRLLVKRGDKKRARKAQERAQLQAKQAQQQALQMQQLKQAQQSGQPQNMPSQSGQQPSQAPQPNGQGTEKQ